MSQCESNFLCIFILICGVVFLWCSETKRPAKATHRQTPARRNPSGQSAGAFCFAARSRNSEQRRKNLLDGWCSSSASLADHACIATSRDCLRLPFTANLGDSAISIPPRGLSPCKRRSKLWNPGAILDESTTPPERGPPLPPPPRYRYRVRSGSD